MNSLPDRLRNYWETTHFSLASARNLPVLSLIGLISGLLVGVVIILFRLLIETAQAALLPDGGVENYESLAAVDRLLLVTGGGLVMGLLFFLVSRPPVRVGVLHVMERLVYQEGHLPVKNAVMQFTGGAVAIISGHSVGREGPGIHLGAAVASLLGQWLQLPNNSIRTLVACGSAAAIGALFNTPLAGVIFAMEVVIMEYTISGFTPVILAAFSATASNRLVFDAGPVFHVPPMELASYSELAAIVIMGIAIGGLAACFIAGVRWTGRHGSGFPVWLRMPLASAGVGICAWLVPEVMGVGYDTVNAVLLGEIALGSLLLILVCKLVATILCTGMNIPAGFISPILFMGAVFGGVTGLLLELLPGEVSPPGLYAMLGMGAMMGAVLQAPLAALLALLELTGNENIIFPGMLAIVSANLAARELFRQKSILLDQLESTGLDYRNEPVAQSLRRLAVGSVMDTRFCVVPPVLSRAEADTVVREQQPHWLVIQRQQGNLLLPAADLARYLEEEQTQQQIDMLEIPSKRLQLAPIRQQATLQHAYDLLGDVDNGAEALYVTRSSRTGGGRIYGIITRNDIEAGYRKGNINTFF